METPGLQEGLWGQQAPPVSLAQQWRRHEYTGGSPPPPPPRVTPQPQPEMGSGFQAERGPAGALLRARLVGVLPAPSIFNPFLAKCIPFHSVPSPSAAPLFPRSFLIFAFTWTHTHTQKNPFIFFSVTFSSPSRQH